MPLRLFKPLLAGATLSERLIACVGAGLGLALTYIAGTLAPHGTLPAIVAPLGASAVLVFAVPASPLAQPWPVIGGNTISALIGVAIWRLIPDPTVAAGLAVAAAILAMSLLRCLHPPGGAAALTAVIGGAAVHEAGWSFALVPVALNSVALVVAGLAFHRLTRRSYPHHPPAPVPAVRPAAIQPADIDAALAEMHESFDIAREDLDQLVARAQAHAAARVGS